MSGRRPTRQGKAKQLTFTRLPQALACRPASARAILAPRASPISTPGASAPWPVTSVAAGPCRIGGMLPRQPRGIREGSRGVSGNAARAVLVVTAVCGSPWDDGIRLGPWGSESTRDLDYRPADSALAVPGLALTTTSLLIENLRSERHGQAREIPADIVLAVSSYTLGNHLAAVILANLGCLWARPAVQRRGELSIHRYG